MNKNNAIPLSAFYRIFDKNKWNILQGQIVLAIGLMLLLLFIATPMTAQVATFYVNPSGDYSKNGMSWANAKNNLQDAINTLHNYMVAEGLKEGRIFVAAGTYYPDESTEPVSGNIYYSAFKIYEGISIYGGFAADESNDDISPDERLVTYKDEGGVERTAAISQCESLHISSWNLTNRTILDGNMSQAATTFTWNSLRNHYETTFPGNVYHVVWFATNGFYEDDNFPGHARPLTQESVLDGVTIRNGNANNKSATFRDHTSYGGGVYMVKNSTLRNCRIEQCASTRRGGGVYMDGGGNVDHCHVSKCQSTGLGIVDGYGGGICGDYGGTVRFSVIDHCLARFGGGLVLSYEASATTSGNTTTLSYPDAYGGSDYDRLYKMYAVGSVIANNTSTSEAGGVALMQGGSINHCTIVNNACVGIDVSYGGRRYGRTGGLYIDVCGEAYNSALWGNTCYANNNIQYAAHIGKAANDPRNLAGYTPHLYYVGVTNHDLTNWNGTTKNNVYSLERENVRPAGAEHLNTHYVFFRKPSASAGAGDATANVDWTPRGQSSLNKKGVQVTERSSDVTYLNMAHTTKDYLGYIFEAVSTLGALVEAKEVINHVLMDPLDPLPEGRGYTRIPTIFVNADRHLPGSHPSNEAVGVSWTLPMDNISNAIKYFDEHSSNKLVNPDAAEDKLGVNEYFTFEGVNYYEVQILVKEGLYNTAGPSSYDDDALRTAAIRPESGMRFYGGYSASLTGSDISSVARNPKAYPTRISADIIGDGYEKNSVHVVSLTNTANVIIDGFQLYYGRAIESSGLAMSNGGGIIVSNRMTGITNPDPVVEESMRAARRVNMTGNKLRNCVIANCYGDGSAIFVNGTYKTAQLTITNCILHNNTASASSGTVVAQGGSGTAQVVMDHCGIFNNVGYALLTREANSSIRMDNSAIYANNATPLNDRANVNMPLVTSGSNITGSHNIVDNGANLNGFNDGTSAAIFTYSPSDGNHNYPSFVNPTRNVGHSEDCDQTMYGGYADWTPGNMNPVVNAAVDAVPGGYDLTCNMRRNRGGASDVGAIENDDLKADGSVYYVRTTGSDSNDGLSWGTAFKTITKALSTATAGKEIWVAAGTYKERLTMTRGVNVYGGFLATGNPGKRDGERNISNDVYHTSTNGEYVTYVDAESNGRVLDQGDNFPTETVWEGFTFQNGKHGATSSTKRLTNYTANTSTTNYSSYNKDEAASWGIHYNTVTEYSDVEWTDGHPSSGTVMHDEYVAPATSGWTSRNEEDIAVSSPEWVKVINQVAAANRGNSNNVPRDLDNAYKLTYTSDGNTYGYYVTGAASNSNRSLAVNTRRGAPSFVLSGRTLTVTYYTTTSTSSRTTTTYTCDYYETSYTSSGIYGRNYIITLYTYPGAKRVSYINRHLQYYRYHYTGSKNTITYTATGGTSDFTDYGQGCGVLLLLNGTLKNCLIRYNVQDFSSNTTNNNTWHGVGKGGAGAYMGSGSRMENSIIRNNTIKCANAATFNSGAGLIVDGGTLVNSLVVENYLYGGTSCTGAGMYVSSKSKFYNCTFAYNTGYVPYTSGVQAFAPGVWDNAANGTTIKNEYNTYGNSITSEQSSASQFFNCIFWGNTGIGKTTESFMAVARGSYANAVGMPGFLHNCYHAAAVPAMAMEGVEDDVVRDPSVVYITGTGYNSTSDNSNMNYAKDYYEACVNENLFNESAYNYPNKNALDNANAMLDTGNPYILNPLSELKSFCINMGSDDAAQTLELDYDITVDIVGADRVQDCTIDKGAYEYNGANLITPTLDTREGSPTQGAYVLYVTQNGRHLSSGNNPENAACMQKIQKILDAAGRYKYLNPTQRVIVKLASVPGGGYAPRRSSVPYANQELNPRDFSFLIPHGVEVWGGYTDDYVDATNNGFMESRRDVIGNKTLLNGVFQNEEQEVTAYHVLTFTDYVYDENGTVVKRVGDTWLPAEEDNLSDATLLSSVIDDDQGDLVRRYARAVVDGVFIEGGRANGLKSIDRIGGACVVPSYGHLRNCIIQDNSAALNGGGVYLQPRALVSGCVIQKNTAERGGGIYVYEPTAAELEALSLQETDSITFANIISSTIVKNTAATLGGGIRFESNLRANSTVFWMNQANDEIDVSGFIDTGKEQAIKNYPLSYCAVKSVRAAGVGNIEVDGESHRGVRWQNDNGQQDNDYYDLMKSSALARAGMSYNTWNAFHAQFPSLEAYDLAGVARGEYTTDEQTVRDTLSVSGRKVALVVKNNEYIEIGARAENYLFQVAVAPDNLMRRIFVTHSVDLNTDAAEYMQIQEENPYYQQIGSSFANPMQRLSDAFQYIINARKTKDGYGNYINKDKRFEVFIAGGTYFPYVAADGTQNHARAATFLIPEGVTLVGGITPEHSHSYYCQETSADDQDAGKVYSFTIPATGESINLDPMTTEDIKENRTPEDINQNGIIAPWELKNQSILSGQTVNEDVQENVYHVITCLADQQLVGGLPTMYSDDDCTAEVTSTTYESKASLARRAIVIDGVTITEGAAMGYDAGNMLNEHDFYRGGAIMVDGNWDNSAIVNGVYQPILGIESNPNARGMRDIPLVINDCQFVNNKANHGGAIFSNGTVRIFSSNFVQNESDCPTKPEATTLVRYSGGGAVAANGDFMAVNTIFANNEASKSEGTFDINPTIGNSGRVNVPDVEDPTVMHNDINIDGNYLQGFGAVIWGGTESKIRLLNCNLVRNRACVYPAVFNMVPNSVNPEDKLVHYAVNSIFWGNEAQRTKFASPRLMNFGEVYDLTHATRDDAAEAILFSAYPEGRGMPAISNVKNDMTDYKAMPFDDSPLRGYFQFKDASGHFLDETGSLINPTATRYSQLSESEKHKVVQYNHNIILSSDNSAIDGPNFVYPSTIPGIAGYVPSADWQLLRINSLVDNGWTVMNQKITQHIDADGTVSYTSAFKDENYIDDEHNSGTSDTRGIYKYHACHENQYFKSGGEPLIVMDMGTTWTSRIGSEDHLHETPYMRYVSDHGNTLCRISPHEDYSADDFNSVPTYIDIGVYEYQHLKLHRNRETDLDVIWVVAPPEGHEMTSTEVDGTKDNPYTDLQTAINDLLRYRNNHPKLIKLGQGVYNPVTIDVRDNNDGVVLHRPVCDGDIISGVDEGGNTILWGIKSLTIRGGYKVDANGHGVEECDPIAFPSVIKAVNYGSHHSQRALIDIRDAENKFTEFSTANGRTLLLHTEGKPIPITLENLSFLTDQSVVYDNESEDDFSQVSPSAVHYKPQYMTEWSGERYIKTSTLLLPSDDGKPKLTIRNCTFNRCTDLNGHGVTTVGIEGGGGTSLIANTVIHHSSGRPLSALNTQVVNCTFAHNGRHMRLVSNTERGAAYQSSLHNSVVWLDDQRDDVDPSDPSITTKSDFEFMRAADNAATILGATPVDATGASYVTGNALSRLVARDDTHNNDPLSSDNTDLAGGPCFNAPEQWNPENGEYGDFSILPNLTLLSKANVDTYKSIVGGFTDYSSALASVEGYDESGDDQVLMMQGDKLEPWTALAPALVTTDELEFKPFSVEVPVSEDLDASGHPRLVATLDRGAYECHAILNRVAYVKPASFKPDQDGTSWYDAYGNGELQKAINSVAVYQYVNGKSGYVFVQGGGTPEHISMREGVEVYGSLPPGTGEQVQKAGEDYTDEEISEYVDNLRRIRPGLVLTQTQPTQIYSVAANLDFQSGALLDGFKIEPSGSETLTSSPVNVTAASGLAIVRNVLIDGFHVKDAPVVKLSGGLLYNALIRDNYTSASVGVAPAVAEVSQRGRMLNATVVAALSGQTTISAQSPDGSPDAPVVLNTIAYNTADREAQTLGDPRAYGNCYEVPATKPTVDYTWHTFAPYLRSAATSYGNFNENRNLWYQLHERSMNMNTGTNDTGEGNVKTMLDNDFQRSAVDYENDLDVLGNPRLIAGRVDRGCFETCHVTASDGVVVIDKQSDNHAGQYYPHPGSVFYLLEDAVCVMRSGDFTTPLQPGYLLMKEGASLYVNGSLTPGPGGTVITGNRLLLNHVAVERKATTRQQLISLPYVVNTSVASAPVYQSSYDALVRNDGVSFTPYEYNGELRSRYHGFSFSGDASDCWSPIVTQTIPANKGWLMDLGEDFVPPGVGEEAANIRFTAIGENTTDFVYREGEEDKTIVLTQHDDRISTNGGGDFTAQENMGWNLVGMPYLVSDYKTYALDANGDYDSGSEDWRLFAPKTCYTIDELNQYSGVRSWDDGATMTLGIGYFMQTATLSDSETLTYKLPFYSLPSPAKPTRYALPFAHRENSTSGYRIWSSNGRLYVSGLQEGDNISLYTISALSVCSDKATSYSWSCPVRTGVYVIRINNLLKQYL